MTTRLLTRSSGFTAPAKFPGRCYRCGEAFPVGALIHAHQSDGRWMRKHAECPADREVRESQELRRQTREDLRASLQALVNPLQRRELPGRRMHGWSDEYQEEWPIVVPSIDDAQLRAAVQAHNQSSRGALRWCTFSVAERPAPDRVVVNVSEHLCD
jgi:hypothetical protein